MSKSAHERLAAWRERKGLTLIAAADLLGTKWWSLRRYEVDRVPPVAVAIEIERVAGIPISAWAKREAA